MSNYDKSYYDNNKEKIMETAKLYYQNNEEKVLERSKIYYQENKDKIQFYNCSGFCATLWPMYVPFMTSACWVLCSGLGRILTLDFVENLTGPPQELALLSLGVSALNLFVLLGWSRVLCPGCCSLPRKRPVLTMCPTP
jgi:hypothetical protein